MSLYNADGQRQVTIVNGTSYTGLYAIDGSYNGVINDGVSTYTGVSHPCGAMNVSVVTDPSSNAYANNGSLNIISSSNGYSLPGGTWMQSWVPNPQNPPDIAINWATNQAWKKSSGLTTIAALGITTSRASVKQVVDSNGNWSQVAANVTARSNIGRSTEEARTNVLLWSQAFDNAVWNRADTTVTVNATRAPDGTVSADLLTEGVAGTAQTAQAVSASVSAAIISGQIFLKPSANNAWCRILLTDNGVTNGASVWVNLSTGALGTVSNRGTGTNSSAQVEPAANGFTRVKILTTLPSGAAVAELLVNSASSDNSATRVNNAAYYAWQGDIQIGGSVTSYIVTTTAAATRNSDVTSMPVMVGSAYTLFEQATPQAPVSFGTTQGMLVLDDGTSNNRASLRRAAVTAIPTFITVGGTGVTVSPAGSPAWAQNVQGSLAVSVAAGSQNLSYNNGAIATGSAATLPSGLAYLCFGEIAYTASGFFNGLATIDAIWLNQAIPNAQLQAMV